MRPSRIPRRPLAGALGLALALGLAACASTVDGATTEVDLGGAVTGSQASRPTTTTTGRPTTTGATTDGTTSLPRACTLLAQADVEAAFGEDALAATDTADECWWSSANDLRTANLIRRTGDLDAWRAGFDNDTWRPNDLGDEGYTSTMLGSVVWRVGEAQYEVNVIYSTSGDEQGDARELARQAAARL